MVKNNEMAMKFIKSRAKLKSQTKATIVRALAEKLSISYHLAFYYVDKVWPNDPNYVKLSEKRFNAKTVKTKPIKRQKITKPENFINYEMPIKPDDVVKPIVDDGQFGFMPPIEQSPNWQGTILADPNAEAVNLAEAKVS